MAHDVARIGGRFYSLVAVAMRANASGDSELIGAAQKSLKVTFTDLLWMGNS